MPCLLYTAPVGDIQIYLVFNPQIPKDAESVLIILFASVNEVQTWMMSNEVVNEDKTEFLVIASPNNHHLSNFTLRINNATNFSIPNVRNLGVVFDQKMNMNDHVTQLSQSGNFHLCKISKICPYIDHDTCHAVTRSLILSRLNDCNSLMNLHITSSNIKDSNTKQHV